MKKILTIILLAILCFNIKAQTTIDYLAPFGIEGHSYNEANEVNPSVEIVLGNVTTTSIEATFTPNDDCASYYLFSDTQSNVEMWMSMMGVSLEEIIVMWGLEKTSTYTHTWNEFVPNTEYTIYALPEDAEGNAGELVTMQATTELMGGEGVSIIDLEVIVINDSTVRTIATPNEETASYHYGLIEKAYFEEIGEEAAVQYFREDPYVFYEVDDWTWSPLTPETDFIAISTGQNAAGEWGETTMVHFTTTGGVGCPELIINNLRVYPNPASSYVNITSDTEEGTEIKIFDMTGRCVKNITSADLRNVTVNIEDLRKGIYVIDIKGNTRKLIVE